MRIKRITPPKMSFAGKIKIGEKRISANGKEYPAALDYFKMYCEVPEYVEAFKSVYGEKPQKLTIIFPTDSEENIVTRYELRDSGGKLAAYGDGEKFCLIDSEGKQFTELHVSEIINKYGDVDAFLNKSAAHYKGVWKERLQLTFLLPELRQILAYWRFESSAVASSIQQIESAYDTIKALAGTVKMIPFDLVVKKAKSDKSGNKSSFSVVSLVPNLSANNALKVRNLVENGQISQFKGLLTDNIVEAAKPLILDK